MKKRLVLAFVLALAVILFAAALVALKASIVLVSTAAVVAAAWFRLSLMPGVMFGFALTAGDWAGLLGRQRDSIRQQSKSTDVRAAMRSIISHTVMLAVMALAVMSAESSSSHYFRNVMALSASLEAGFLLSFLSIARNSPVRKLPSTSTNKRN